MDKLSVVIITYNEENNITKCLDSINNIADEIVIVDSFSNDNTESLCLEYDKVNFIKHKFDGYGPQKQFAMNCANNDFVLSVDADEYLDSELANHILACKQEGFKYNSYTIIRNTQFLGRILKHGEIGNEKILRLFNRKKASFTSSKVHEKLEIVDDKVGKLKGCLIHNPCLNSESFIAKLNKYSSFWAQDKHSIGKRTTKAKIFFKMFFKFVWIYLLRLGILDGFPGFLWSKNMAFYSYLKYAKLYELQNK